MRTHSYTGVSLDVYGIGSQTKGVAFEILHDFERCWQLLRRLKPFNLLDRPYFSSLEEGAVGSGVRYVAW